MTTESTPGGLASTEGLGAGAGASQVPPMRALRLTLKLEADDRREMAWALRNMADQIEREQLTVGVSGGPHSGAIYELLADPTQTHERYFREVQEYLRSAPNVEAKGLAPEGNSR